jgi:hypothetical protein
MKRIITATVTVIATAAVLLGLAAAPVSAARLPGEPIPGCQHRAYPPSPLYWSDALNFWYTARFRTSNGTCSRDAVRFYLRRWSENSTVCGRFWLRTYNDDGTLRRVWPSVELCPGQEGGFLNVDNRRLARLEMRVNSGNQQSWNSPSGSLNY